MDNKPEIELLKDCGVDTIDNFRGVTSVDRKALFNNGEMWLVRASIKSALVPGGTALLPFVTISELIVQTKNLPSLRVSFCVHFG